MKPLALAAVASALTTAVAAWALRATDATTAVAVVAAVAVATAWLARFHDGTDGSGVALTGPAQLGTLTLVGRASAAGALPVVAAQVVGAVAAGAAVAAVDLPGGTLVWDEPTLLAGGVLAAVVGLLTAWATLAGDAGSPAWQAVGPVAAGGLLGVGLAAAAQPAAVLGLATAGVVAWPLALVVAAATLVGALLGTFVVSWVSPHAE
ncbi:MAG: hypothetical protein NTV28_14005 [Propionibacteriales bacterium]|nr:hypothetical protein [Propionibacteriales bacterium]